MKYHNQEGNYYIATHEKEPIDPWTLLDYPNLYHAPDFIETIRSPKTPPFVSQLESFEQRLLTLDF